MRKSGWFHMKGAFRFLSDSTDSFQAVTEPRSDPAYAASAAAPVAVGPSAGVTSFRKWDSTNIIDLENQRFVNLN